VSARGQVVKAMAVIRRPRDSALLVSEHAEPELFHRPLGGHVEFGEYALDTVHRELQEEIGQGLAQVRLLGVLENIFPWRGGIEHEIVFLYAAAFSDAAAYEIDEQGIRDEADGRTRVIWRPPGALSPPLYPAGVAVLIATAQRP
jgi:ADP-ribose pyrophosphatase YjhB (NUDIX family)